MSEISGLFVDAIRFVDTSWIGVLDLYYCSFIVNFEIREYLSSNLIVVVVVIVAEIVLDILDLPFVFSYTFYDSFNNFCNERHLLTFCTWRCFPIDLEL